MVRQVVSIENNPDETSHACVAGSDDGDDNGDGDFQVIATVVALLDSAKVAQ